MTKKHMRSLLLFPLLALIVYNNMQASDDNSGGAQEENNPIAIQQYSTDERGFLHYLFGINISRGSIALLDSCFSKKKEKEILQRSIFSLTNACVLQSISLFATCGDKPHSVINVPFDFENKPLKSCIANVISIAGEAGTSFFLQTLYDKFANRPIHKTIKNSFKKLPKPVQEVCLCSAFPVHLATVRVISKLAYRISTRITK